MYSHSHLGNSFEECKLVKGKNSQNLCVLVCKLLNTPNMKEKF